VNAGPGDDRIHAFGGGKNDIIDCGSGNDVADVDVGDSTRNCEVVRHR